MSSNFESDLPEPEDYLKKGTVLSPLPYRLEKWLGKGGFGEVWKAINPETKSYYALKFIHHHADLKTLRNEARHLVRIQKAIASLEGFVKLHEFFYDAQPFPFVAYEYVEAKDFAWWLQNERRFRRSGEKSAKPRCRPFSPQEAADVIYELACIVGQLHRLKDPIVHRDLKPQNILILGGGSPWRFKILDFGLGVVAAEKSRVQALSLSDIGQKLRKMGTSAYASCEQRLADHQGHPSDDVHALGVIWYELLVGELGTFSNGPPSLQRHFDWETFERELRSYGVDSDQARLLMSCLQPHQDRPANAAILSDSLSKLSQHQNGRPLENLADSLAVQPSVPIRASSLRSDRQEQIEVGIPAEWHSGPHNLFPVSFKRIAVTPGVLTFSPDLALHVQFPSDVSDSHIECLSSLQLANLVSLERCKYFFEESQLTNAGMSHLGKLSTLRWLTLGKLPHISDEGVVHLCYLSVLQDLDLSGCQQIAEFGFASLGQITSLQDVNFARCRIRDISLVHYARLPRLQRLYLRDCAYITDLGLGHLANSPSLQELCLAGCERITDAGLHHLGNIGSLKELNLDNCPRFTNEGLSALKSLRSLEGLSLLNCNISLSGLLGLVAMPMLQRLSVSGCKLTQEDALSLKRALPGCHISGV